MKNLIVAIFLLAGLVLYSSTKVQAGCGGSFYCCFQSYQQKSPSGCSDFCLPGDTNCVVCTNKTLCSPGFAQTTYCQDPVGLGCYSLEAPSCVWTEDVPTSGSCYQTETCQGDDEFCSGCIQSCRNIAQKNCNQQIAEECEDPGPVDPGPGCQYDPASCSKACGQLDNCGNACGSGASGPPGSNPAFTSPTIDANGNVALPSDGNITISWTKANKAENYQLEIFDAEFPQNNLADNNSNAYLTNAVTPSYPESNAFDENNKTQWKSFHKNNNVVNTPDFIGVKFSSPRLIRAISLDPGVANERVSRVRVEYRNHPSDEGATSDWASAGVIELNTASGQKQYYPIPNPPAVGFYRWRLVPETAPQGGAGYQWSVQDIGMYGQADANNPIITFRSGSDEENNGRSYTFRPSDLATTNGKYVVRVRAENNTCTTITGSTGYSPWVTTEFDVTAPISGSIYNDPDSTAQFNGSACTLAGAQPLGLAGGSVSVTNGTNTYTTAVTGSSFSFAGLPLQKPVTNYDALLTPGTSVDGNPLVCACPTANGSGQCVLDITALPATNVNFYLNSLVLSNYGWWQVQGGNVYAGYSQGGTIRSYVPYATCTSAAGCVAAVLSAVNPADLTTAGIAVTGLSSTTIDTTNETGNATTYLSQRAPIQAAQGTKPSKVIENFAYFSRQFSLGPTPASDFAPNAGATAKPNIAAAPDKVVYYHDGDMTLSSSSPWVVAAGEKLVIMVDGNLTITDPGNVTPNDSITSVAQGGFLSFIVSGDILIDETVGNSTLTTVTPNLEGVFIADGTIEIQSRGEAAGGDDRFVGAGSFIGWTDVVLDRDFSDGDYSGGFVRRQENNDTPVELFLDRPDFIIAIPEEMAKPNYIWQETN